MSASPTSNIHSNILQSVNFSEDVAVGSFGDAAIDAFADDLIAYYEFDETSGTTAEDIVGSNDGTISGSVTVNATGKSGTSFDFGGGHLTFGANAAMKPAIISGSMWVKRDTDGNNQVFLCNGEFLGGTARGVLLRTSFAGNFAQINIGNGTTAASMNSSNTITADGSFHLVVFTHTGSTSTLYVDGVKTTGTTTTLSYTGGGSDDVRMGLDALDADPMDGPIDEFALWGVAIDDAAAAALYNAGAGKFFNL